MLDAKNLKITGTFNWKSLKIESVTLPVLGQTTQFIAKQQHTERDCVFCSIVNREICFKGQRGDMQ